MNFELSMKQREIPWDSAMFEASGPLGSRPRYFGIQVHPSASSTLHISWSTGVASPPTSKEVHSNLGLGPQNCQQELGSGVVGLCNLRTRTVRRLSYEWKVDCCAGWDFVVSNPNRLNRAERA